MMMIDVKLVSVNAGALLTIQYAAWYFALDNGGVLLNTLRMVFLLNIVTHVVRRALFSAALPLPIRPSTTTTAATSANSATTTEKAVVQREKSKQYPPLLQSSPARPQP